MEVHTSHLVVSPVPHVRASLTTRRVMANVILALLPALIASVFIFGLRALLVTAATVAACVAMEWAWCALRHEKQTVGDLSAVVTGLLLAFNLPSTVPLYLPIMGAAAAMSALCGQNVLTQLLSGGLLLGAFFMATDYTTSPFTRKGKLIFGVGCGLITCAIRFWGNMNEGVSYSILLMNLTVPYINAKTRKTPMGGGKRK